MITLPSWLTNEERCTLLLLRDDVRRLVFKLIEKGEAMEKVVEAAKRWKVAYWDTDASYMLNMEARQGLSDALASLTDAKEPMCEGCHMRYECPSWCPKRYPKADAKEPCYHCDGSGCHGCFSSSLDCCNRNGPKESHAPGCQPSGDEQGGKP